LLTLLAPGLGHVYLGQARRGILLFCLILVADVLLMFALMGVLARFWMFAISLALLFGLWLFILVDAVKRAQRMQDYPQYNYNRWPVYAGTGALAWLVTALPCIYASHAKSLGHLGYFHATAASMEPTLRVGEVFMADATYYRSHPPRRGEVAVYVHPTQPNQHSARRIVAVEGDRIAVRGGNAVVNGIPVQEPYARIMDPKADLNNRPETRVPAGHVYVLADNRDDRRDGVHSSDSRDAVAHGPVPVRNLIGRVTDIAFSRVVGRMGRWIGTPNM
jgi:signal peptidase I